MSSNLTRRELLKLGSSLPFLGRGEGAIFAGVNDAAVPAASLATLEVIVPISLSHVPGPRTSDGDLVLRPGAPPLRFEVEAPEKLVDMAWRLRLINEVEIDPVMLTHYDFQKFYDLIDDALDGETTHHQTHSLLFEGTGEPRTQAAYMRVLWNFGARPGTYPFTIWAKKEGLEVLPGGRMGIEVTLYRKRPQRRLDDISGPPDSAYFLEIGGGTVDWKQYQLPVPMDNGVACALFRIVGEKYRGKVWLEDPRFVGSAEDSGALVQEPGYAENKGISSLPPFAPDKAFEPYRTWLGVNLSRLAWPEFRLTLNGKEFFNGRFFQNAFRWPAAEVEVPAGLLRPGKNELEVKLEKDYAGRPTYYLRAAQWLGTPGGRLEVVACPELVEAAKEFWVLVRTREENLRAEVEVLPLNPGPASAITAVSPEITFGSPDLHLVKFRAAAAGPGATLRLRFGSEERRVTVRRVVDRPEDGIALGSGDLVWAAYHKPFLQNFLAWYMHNSIGNFMLFRFTFMDSAGTRYYDQEAWTYLVQFCKEAGLRYAMAGDQSELPETDSFPPDELLQGPHYMGYQEYELDGCYNYWAKDFRRDPLQVWTADFKNAFRLPELALHVDLFDRNPRRSRCPHPSDPRLASDTMLRYRWASPYVAKNMREGSEYFKENITNTIPGGPRHCGPATIFKYFLQVPKYKYLLTEGTYGPYNVVLAALRGASRAYGKSGYGVELCDQWSTSPMDDPAAFRRYFLGLATCYLHGVQNIFQQECLWRIVYRYTAQDRFSPACQGHLKVHQAFYRFTRAHSRRGRMRVPVGFLHGQYDGWDCTGNPMVWGQAGEEWNVGPPEQSWELVKTFCPRSVLSLIFRNPCPHEPVGFFTGTPYGPIDIVPIEAEAKHLGLYRSLVLVGWNTADEAQLDRLIDYVEKGGHLTLGLVHLSTEVRRNQPPQPIASPQVRKLLGLEIRGLKASAGNYAGNGAQGEALAKLVKTGAMQLGDVELREAVARVSDGQGTPLLVERQLGKGRVTFLNTSAYPGEPPVAKLYEELLRSAGSDSLSEERQRVWVKGSDDVSFSVWDWEGNSGNQGTSTIYLLNVNWWSEQPQPATAQLLWGNAEIPLSIARDRIHLITVSGDWGIWTDDGETDVIAIEPAGKSAKVKLQGQGKTTLTVLYRPQGSGARPKLRGRSGKLSLRLDPLAAPGLWRTELMLNGPAELEIQA